MKCYAVNIMTPDGDFKSVYIGADLGEAKRIYREYKRDKFDKDCIAAFLFSKPTSRRVSGGARHLVAIEKAKAEAARGRDKDTEKLLKAKEKAEAKELERVEAEKAKEAEAVKERQQKEKAEQIKRKADEAKAKAKKEADKTKAVADAVAKKLKGQGGK